MNLRREYIEVDPNDIDFGARYRQDYSNIDDLVEDFQTRGVLQPIVIVPREKLSTSDLLSIEALGDEPYILLAGGRRTKAAIAAELETIPAMACEYVLDELELRIIELHENILRKPFDMYEELQAKARIHDLMVEKYGEKISTAPDAPGHSMADTAKMIGVSPATMSRDVKLARAMEEHPELRESTNKKDAQKKYDQLVKKAAMDELARRHKAKQADKTDDSKKMQTINSYQLGNFFEHAAKLPAGTYGLAEIDPPYAVDLKSIKREGKTENYNEIDAQVYETFMRATFNQTYHLLKEHAWMLCWFGPDPWFEPIAQWIIEAGKPEDMDLEEWVKSGAGFQLRRLPAVWIKRNGQTNQPHRYLASAVEYFFYARKGKPALNKQGRVNVFDYSPVSPKKKRHPTERPIEMIQDIITTFVAPGQPILVPFAGSGNTLLAASNLGSLASGFDLSKAYKESFDVEASAGTPGKYASY